MAEPDPEEVTLRIPADTLALIERAADARCQDLDTFILEAARKLAERVVAAIDGNP